MAQTPKFPSIGDTLLGRYRLTGVLARGGMGMVFVGTQLSMDREVAIKMVLPHMTDRQEVMRRFEREVHLAKQMRHPNVVELYDFGRTEDGLLYLVMEYMRGEDLKSAMKKRGPMPVSEAGHIALQVLDALSVAHAAGIVHRDLKPSNVFLTSIGRHTDFAKLLDFGVAKSLVQDDTDLTQQGRMFGTSSYMAPEMFVTQAVDLSIDVYAMGVIFLEMLIGQKVFRGTTAAENMVLHLRKGVTVPPVFEGTPLGRFLARATARRAANRYQDASAMLEALEEALQDVPDDLVVPPEQIAACIVEISNRKEVLDRLLLDDSGELEPPDSSAEVRYEVDEPSGDVLSAAGPPKQLPERTLVQTPTFGVAHEMRASPYADFGDAIETGEEADASGAVVQFPRAETPGLGIEITSPRLDDAEQPTVRRTRAEIEAALRREPVGALSPPSPPRASDDVDAEDEDAGTTARMRAHVEAAIAKPGEGTVDDADTTRMESGESGRARPATIGPEKVDSQSVTTQMREAHAVPSEDRTSRRRLAVGGVAVVVLVVSFLVVWGALVSNGGPEEAAEQGGEAEGLAPHASGPPVDPLSEPAAEEGRGVGPGEPQTLVLVVESTPEGAAIFHEGSEWGATPYEGEHSVDEFPLELELRKEGFVTATVKPEQGEDPTVRVSATLEPQPRQRRPAPRRERDASTEKAKRTEIPAKVLPPKREPPQSPKLKIEKWD